MKPFLIFLFTAWTMLASAQNQRDTIVLYFMLEGCKKSTVPYMAPDDLNKPCYWSPNRRRLFYVEWVERRFSRGRWKFTTIKKIRWNGKESF